MTGLDPIDPAVRRRNVWRVGTPLVVLLSGALFVVSATTSEGTDLRPGRYTDLASLTQNESEQYERLQAEEARLRGEVDALTESVDDARVRREQQVADRLRDPAGLVPVRGAGLSIVLADAPEEALEEALRDPDPRFELDRLVVHQQDIQAVVNALWAGGAEAVTVQGQRVVTSTGIKCTGSAVQLQGVPYPQPYTIEAVGDPAALQAAIDASQDVTDFRVDATRPDIGIGWSLTGEADVEAPAYAGLLDLGYAEPLTRLDS